MAAEYGWTKEAILNQVYVDEVLELRVRRRRRKLEDKILDLRIIMAPHMKQEARDQLIDELQGEIKVLDDYIRGQNHGSGSLGQDPPVEKLDRAGLNHLRLIAGGKQRLKK